MISPRSLLAFLVITGFLGLTGCSNDGKMAITGNVTLKGKPLEDGTITFYPVDTGTRAGTGIVNGKYEIKRELGLVPGKYRVSITSPDGFTPTDPKTPPGPSGNFTSKDRISADWNTDSKKEIEVTATGPNQFDFPIP